MVKNNFDKKRALIFGTLVLTIVVVLSGITYAFFSAGVTGEQEKLSLSTGTMELTFADNDNGIDEQLSIGQSVTKKFKIINTGTLEASMSLDWVKLVNTYTNGSLTYTLSYSETEDGTPTNLLTDINVPVSSEELSQTIESEISVPAHETHYYYLTITLNDLPDVDQTADAGAEFRTMFSAGQPLTYRYYTLTVDPNGGTWGEFTAPQTYQLKNNETMNITDVPTKVGSTFREWKLTGVASELNGNTFTMGISDATLVALWDLQKIPVTVNGTTQEVEYGSTFDLGTPPEKEGYTFTGWSATGGIVSGNTLTVNTTDNITVTPTYTVNKYKYIVYHNKQNVDGNGYTLVSADTDEDEAEYNTKVTPETKTYTGFTSPTPKELTIKAETTYPPVLNKVDYNYNRNKYTLTINPNGGTYNSKTENTVVNDIYYEATYSLGTPTKTGYDFANWSNSGGTLNDNTFTMGDADATVTANWNAVTYSVTFNANGGTVSTASKTVTYDSTYSALPEPTYAGYSFLGWYTEQTGGTQITADTLVTITANQELFAHWIRTGTDITLTKLNITPKSGTPTLANAATTDEGVYSMADDYGTSYYYRGAVTNNYVKFGKWAAGTLNAGKDMWWRIIRVNGDGSIRMIYDGTQAYGNANGGSGSGGADRFTSVDKYWNNLDRDAKYVGYMYGGANGSPSSMQNGLTSEAATFNETDSLVKTEVDNWYKVNIFDNGFDKYISDEIFCNDRSTAPNGSTWWTSENPNYKGFSGYPTMFGTGHRVFDNNFGFKSPEATFLCTNKNDAFTVDDTTKGNGALTYKVGLITSDEVVTAGNGKSYTANKYFYLYKNNSYSYWTMSPGIVTTGANAGMLAVNKEGTLNNLYVNDIVSIAPVINISPVYAAQLTGSGTTSSPFQISGVA